LLHIGYILRSCFFLSCGTTGFGWRAHGALYRFSSFKGPQRHRVQPFSPFVSSS
jgi:hypothetical protein